MAPRKSLEPRNLLEKTTFWPFRISRIFGFWPFALYDGQLYFRWASPGTFLAVINLCIYATLYVIVGAHKELIISHRLENPSTTQLELRGQSAIAIMKSHCVIFLYLSSFLNRHNFATVWNNITRIVNGISACAMISSPGAQKLALFEARNIRQYKYLTLYILALSLLHVATEVPAMTYAMSHRVDVATNIRLSLITSLWTFYSNMYAYFVVILAGMVHIIQDCFYLLSLAVEEILRRQKSKAEQIVQASPNTVYDDRQWQAKKIQHLMKCSRDLEATVEDLNDRLKPQLLFITVVMVFIQTLGAFYVVKIISTFRINVDYLGTVTLVILSYSIFHIFCRRCGELVKEAQNYGRALTTAVAGNFEPDVMAMIQLEANRFIVKPPTVSPGQFFTIRTELISSVLALLATYSVVLYQFDQEATTTTPCLPHLSPNTTMN